MSENSNKKDEKECCPKFDPAKWDGKVIEWKNKPFVKDHVKAAFYVPIGIKEMMMKNMELIGKAQAMGPREDLIVLASDQSMWGADYYISATKEFPGVEIVKLSGKFLAKVFEGSFSKMHSWIKEMEQYVKDKNEKLEKLYFYYTTCPECAKKYGKNYIVILAKI